MGVEKWLRFFADLFTDLIMAVLGRWESGMTLYITSNRQRRFLSDTCTQHLDMAGCSPLRGSIRIFLLGLQGAMLGNGPSPCKGLDQEFKELDIRPTSVTKASRTKGGLSDRAGSYGCLCQCRRPYVVDGLRIKRRLHVFVVR